jgi:hypothetical protein
MQTIQDGDGYDLAPTANRSRRTDEHDLTHPLMGVRLVEIPEAIFLEDTLEVTLPEHEDMIDALAANAPKKTFDFWRKLAFRGLGRRADLRWWRDHPGRNADPAASPTAPARPARAARSPRPYPRSRAADHALDAEK